ncbi:hypothetical protein R1sor_005622 [Riccia sorocarpa]|uniref:Uncharacterized protein n=1 Tax=Riccia sorocarpa TaxID=122646 RepID=A0ABD3HME4_9MARC
MQTPYFTKGQMEPMDPTKAVENENEGEKSVERKDKRDGDGGGSSGREERKEAKEGDEGQGNGPMQKEPTESTGQQKQQQNNNNETNNGSFAGVRKILHPAEEALDSARHTAELIMKDAMDALLKTKQRLMEILPSLMPSHTASDAAKVVENVEEDMLAKSEGAEPPAGNGDKIATDEKLHPTDLGLTHNESTGVARNSTSGFQEPSSTEPQSVKRKLPLAKL